MALNIILSTLAAVIPTGVYVVLLWRLDRYEKEPLVLFAAAFVWGAVPAVLASLFSEVGSSEAFAAVLGSWSEFVSVGVLGPVIEESFKSLALLLLFWFFRSEFDGVLDGIIYGSAIGFGFAMTENIVYFVNAWSGAGLNGWIGLVLVRVGAFGLNHAMYTALAGAALGYARLRKHPLQRCIIYLLGFMAAIAVHMLHNILVAGLQACLLGFLIDWSGVVMLFVTILLSWRHERRIVRMYLKDEVDLGTLSNADYEQVVATTKSTAALRAKMSSRTHAAAQRWQDYQQIATRLAFKKYERVKVGDEGHNSQLIADLREKLVRMRAQM